MKTKMRKFGAWLMAAALAFAGAGAVQAAVTTTEELKTAIANANTGDTIMLAAGEFDTSGGDDFGPLANKKVTIKGAGQDPVTGTKLLWGTGRKNAGGAELTFENLYIDIASTPSGAYQFEQNFNAIGVETYRNVTFKGAMCTQNTAVFDTCTFVGPQTGALDEYLYWQYRGTATMTDCKFLASGPKGPIKLYAQKGNTWKFTMSGCSFADEGTKGGAIYATSNDYNNDDNKPPVVCEIYFGEGNTVANGGNILKVKVMDTSWRSVLVVDPQKDESGKYVAGTFYVVKDDTKAKAALTDVFAADVEVPAVVNGQVVIEGAGAPEVEVVTPTVDEQKGITQEIVNQIAANTEVAKVENTGLKAALAEDETLKDAEAVVKVELTEVAPTTGVLTYEIKPVVKGEGETPDEDISAKVVGKPITFRVPLTDAFTKFAKVTHKGTVDEISHVEVLGAAGARYVELTFNHFSEVEFDPELAFPGLPETAVKVVDGFYQSAPTYTASTDFYIVSKAGLEYFRDLVNGKDVLDAYIASDCGKSLNRSVMRFSGKTVKLLADINLNNEIWEPISVNSDKDVFCGTFDGGNHVISNLKVVYEGSTTKAGAGLFGYIKNAVTIQNVTIDNADISGFDCVGGVVGISSSSDTVIRNCKLTGSVSITSRSSFVGGIIGHTYAKEISGCSVEATGGTGIYCGGSGIRVGGICGYDQNPEAVLEDCHVENIDIAMAHRYLIGGIVGTVVSGAKVIRCDVEDVNISCNFEPNYGLIVGLVDGSSNLSIVEDCSAVNSTATGKTTEGGDDTTKIANTELVGRTGAAGSVGSPSANLVVGSDIDYDENGKIKGGTFDVLPESAIAEGFEPLVDPETGKIEVEKIKAAEVFDGDVSMGKFETLDEALATATDGKTLKLLTDLDSIGTKTLNGIVFDGNGHKITGASALYFGPAKTTTIKNVVFENIHNAEGKQSAIYGGEFSTGSITITGCTFDTCDWDAIQIVPANGATGEVVITNNVFKHTDTTKSQLRYIHIQHMQETDVHPVPVSMMITDNRFLDVEKSASGEKIDTVSISSVKNTPTTQLSGNYYSDSSTIYVTGDLPLQLYYPMRSQPTVDVDDVPFPMFSIGSATYATLAEAVAAANAANALVTINLNGDLTVDETVEIRNANAKSIAFNGNGHVITANTTMFRVATQLNFTGYNSMSSTPSGLVTCPADSPLFVVDGGTLNVNNGIYTKDITSLINAHLYHLVTNAEGNFVVEMLNDTTALAEGYVAHTSSTGGYYYKTLAELFSEKTIAELLTDVSEDVTASKAVTIRSADKTFVGSVDVGNALNASFYSDATLESVVCNQLNVGYSYATYGVSTVTVKGGTVNALNVNATYGKLIIQGGTFGVDPTAYVDGEIYNVTELGTTPQTWEVTEKTSIAAVVSAGGIQTNEYKTLSKALQDAQEGQKVILLADTAEENVPLKLEQEIVLNGHAFTGTVDPALVPAGYDAKVPTPDGRLFTALAKVEVPIGESSVIKVRMEGTAENLKTVQANGRPLWANKALGIANDFKILPMVERPAAGSKTISIKSNIPDSVLEAAAQQRDGVSVKFQLAKKVGTVGNYVQFGEKQPKPEFTVEADEQEVQTFWKIQIFFEEEY